MTKGKRTSLDEQLGDLSTRIAEVRGRARTPDIAERFRAAREALDEATKEIAALRRRAGGRTRRST